jgi:hypothetical protein
MSCIHDLESIQKTHSALFSNNAAADPRFSADCRFLVSRLRYLASDIREHAAKGSGPRRKEWHAIMRKVLAIADDVSHIQKSGPTAVMALGLKEYGDIMAMIQDMGDF